jgi:hypothetical protein
MYTAGSQLNKEDFVSYMKDRAAGISRPRPEPRAPEEAIPVNTIDTSGIPENTPPPADTAAQPDKMQQQMNEIEQLKQGNGGNVLSGAPPDRNTAPVKQDTVPATPPAAPKTDELPIPAETPASPPPTVPKIENSTAPATTPDVPKTDSVGGQPH